MACLRSVSALPPSAHTRRSLTLIVARQSAIKRSESGNREFLRNLEAAYEKAPAAKMEVDQIAQQIAAAHGGRVMTTEVKARERAIQKIINNYDGDVSQIKDLARNTIVAAPDQLQAVVADLVQRGAKLRVWDDKNNSLGYSGTNAWVMTRSGITAEIQINTPQMIYAKEPEAISRLLLGNRLYDTIAAQIGMPGGVGHEIYKKWRVLDPKSKEAIDLAEKSRGYYEKIGGWNGNK